MSILNDSGLPPTARIPSPHHLIGGTVLTFPRFIYLIIKIAHFAYISTPQSVEESTSEASQYSLAERLCFLLERMELSDGFSNIEKRTNRPHTARTSLLPSDTILKKVEHEKENEGGDPIKEEGKRGKKLAHLPQEPSRGVSGEYPENENDFSERPEEKYKEQLRVIFERYCAYGEPMNTTRLKSSKFMKILKDCSLVINQPLGMTQSQMSGILKSVEADLIYTKVTGIKLGGENTFTSTSMLSSTMSAWSPEKGTKILDFNKKRVPGHGGAVSSRIMEFDQFIEALKIIAGKIMPDASPEESFPRLVEEHILPLEKAVGAEREVSNEALLKLMELLREKEMSKFLGIVHRSLLPYFKMYANHRGVISLEGFLKLCGDFGIFPDIVPKPRLTRIFYTIASIYSSGDLPSVSCMERENRTNATIDDHLFIEAIALCAFEIPYRDPQPSNFEKILFLVERMSQAKGSEIVQKAHGSTRFPNGLQNDMLSLFRQYYPEMFALPAPAKKKNAFFELLKK